MNKYYTPEISEFHVGFEYEAKVPNGEWISICYTELDKNTIYDVEEKLVRTKYLDREDIECFGIEEIKFEFDNNSEPIPPRKDSLEMPKAYGLDDQLITGQAWILYHYEKDNVIWIEYIKDCSGEGYLFKGKCKNKSRLKLILQWTGIIK